jgi:hypothetical protein
MKNPFEELQKLSEETEQLFEAFGWFKRKPKNQPQATSYLNQHQQNIETGAECAPGKSNGRFTSELGSNEATFYTIKGGRTIPTGTVKNIKPFLDNAGISKKIMRCYNLDKDPLKIAWLFNGEFAADILDWDKKKRKVIFQGTWKKGLFGGINYEAPNVQKPKPNPMESKFFILNQGVEIGPYTAAQIVKMMKNNTVNLNTVVRPEDSVDYQNIGKEKTLKFLLQSAVPTPQPAPAGANRGGRNRNLGQQLP